MLFRALAVSLAVLAVLSCADSPEKPAKSLTGPAAPPPAPSASMLLSQAPAKLGGSRICMKYLKERTRLMVQLKASPNDSTLQRKARHMAAMITDACN